MPTARTRKPARELPQPERPWTDALQDWKIDALGRVLEHLQHICSGPKGHAKSYAFTVAVRHVVAVDADPDSGVGLYLQNLLTSAIAHEISRREEFLPAFRARFPGTPDVSPAFLTKYVNSRWWCEAFCELEQTCCCDLTRAVEEALKNAKEERAKG